MSVRAKFKCETVTLNQAGAVVTLFPVTSGSKENESFFKWTPGGKIELATINKDAVPMFVPGKEYYVDFSTTEITEPGN